MASKKVISVNESSLVDLKAEVYRKETQLKREKVDSNQPKKAPIWQKKKKESRKKDGNSMKESTKSKNDSFDKELAKSRLMLEAKSALYNKLSSGEIEVPSDEDEQDGRFLVDFHQKTSPKVDQKKENIIDSSGQDIRPARNPDEEWVEYVDSFGRSKTCLKKDLPEMKKKDENVRMKSLEESKLTLLSDDMKRELIRKKWKQEVQEALDKPVGPVHYQDIMFDEIRDHGVGYYKFSNVEEERKEQQTSLNKLRTQTEQQRSKREKLLEKRKAAMDARLAKIRERKQRKLREQGVLENTQEEAEKTEDITNANVDEEESKSTNDENDMFVGVMVERIRNKSMKNDKAQLNEWERGKVDLDMFDKPKRKTPSYEPRDERNPEFAPPSFYTDTNEKKSFSKKSKWNQEDERKHNALDVEISEEQESRTTWMEPEHSSTNRQTSYTYRDDKNSSQYYTEWTTQPPTSVTQNYQPTFNNTLPNVQSANVNPQSKNPNVPSSYVTAQNTLPNVQNRTPNLYNTLPNLPPPPIHAFPPPNLPPPFLHSYEHQFQPQYPPNIPYRPNLQYPPPPLPNNQQYPHVPQ